MQAIAAVVDCEEPVRRGVEDPHRARIALEEEPVALLRTAAFVQLSLHRGGQGVHVLCERLYLGGSPDWNRIVDVVFPCCADSLAQPADRRRDLAYISAAASRNSSIPIPISSSCRARSRETEASTDDFCSPT